ncbi:MAG TPA: HAD hydrolase-like protein [Pseudonocardiaceae bacterium]|jgi:phosphoglycolate phosphatase-like HAD superfamily hydrolase|nr:HAD hydrolase-like protein [Pseudonocardiaceae bacterium]
MVKTSALHVIWDWNGTVLNDFDVAFRSTNKAFREVGLPEIDADTYRARLRQPIQDFYAAILGRELPADQCAAIEKAFDGYYADEELSTSLAAELPGLFQKWLDAGHTQSLLSLYRHDALRPEVERRGLSSYFALVQGTTPPYPLGKSAHLADHLAKLDIAPTNAVLIGDLVDDAKAARAAGARIVLYSGGFGCRDNLVATGAPVADSLVEALELVSALR